MSKRSKVAVVYCDSYRKEQVYKAVKSGLEAIGGIDSFVKPNEKILVKPNFLYPSETERNITTNPSVIEAVLRILSENKYANVKIGDSCANGSGQSALLKLGLNEDKLYGAMVAPMNEEVCIKVNEGSIAKRLFITKDAYEADAIIGISKMKTHMLERITGAVKNMYGLICGFRKAQSHVEYRTASDFARMLCDIHKSTHQRLHIMDGITAMEGNGPASGEPVNMNVILMSSDPIALDTVFARLINLKPELVPTIVHGNVLGLGNSDFDKIDIILVKDLKAEPVTITKLFREYGKADFDVQREKDRFNVLQLWSHLNGGTARPYIDTEKCIKCGVCVSHCPVDGKAVQFKNGKDNPPVYNYKKCIRCYCCQELCPQHAISVKR